MDVALPYVVGEYRPIIAPAPSGNTEGAWYCNDHCVVRGPDGRWHIIGINNPYPDESRALYREHPYLGHWSAAEPSGPWERHAWALDESAGCRYLGAPFVTRAPEQACLPEQTRYLMLFETRHADPVGTSRRCLEWASSTDLFTWERSQRRAPANWPDEARDPCIIPTVDGAYRIYLCTPAWSGASRQDGPSGSAITVTETRDFVHFSEPRVCYRREDGIRYGGLESPFVLQRDGIYYLFVTYAHRHYDETLVLASNEPDRFEGPVLTTLFGHACELFEHEGQQYITSCGPEDRQRLNTQGICVAPLGWH